MLSVKLAAVGTLLLGIALGGCGSVALQPGGAAGNDGGAGSVAGAGGNAGGETGHAGAGGSSAAGSPGTVTLRLNLPSSTSFCDVSCGGVAPHITILTLDKKQVPTEIPSCSTVCANNCESPSCPVGGACLLSGVVVTGADLQWDGRSYPTSTCNGGNPCYQPTFVPPGQYLARMCATPGTLSQPTDGPPICTATGPQECVDVVFDLPAKGVVEGGLGDAGKTCGAIQASDYDQSCNADPECVAVGQGDFCQPQQCGCPSAAINRADQMRYEADLASKISTPSICSCPLSRLPACVRGKCVL